MSNLIESVNRHLQRLGTDRERKEFIDGLKVCKECGSLCLPCGCTLVATLDMPHPFVIARIVGAHKKDANQLDLE